MEIESYITHHEAYPPISYLCDLIKLKISFKAFTLVSRLRFSPLSTFFETNPLESFNLQTSSLNYAI